MLSGNFKLPYPQNITIIAFNRKKKEKLEHSYPYFHIDVVFVKLFASYYKQYNYNNIDPLSDVLTSNKRRVIFLQIIISTPEFI